MIAYLIQSTTSEGPPAYYSPDAGRNSGHGIHGWSNDQKEGLGFASPRDAQRFIDALLPRMGDTCRPVPFQRADE